MAPAPGRPPVVAAPIAAVAAGAVAIVLVGVALRLLAVPSALPDTDAVNFSLALERFDLVRHQPHFPGYPLYVLAGRVLSVLGLRAVWALALPGALASAGLLLLGGLALSRHAGRRAALLGMLLVALDPLLVAVGGAPGSDGLALAVAGCGFAVLLLGPRSPDRGSPRSRWSAPLVAGLLLGLALGVRPSYAALVPSLALAAALSRREGPWRDVTLVLVGTAVGTALWLFPFVALVGPGTLLEAARVHVSGHAERLGASVPPGSMAVRAGVLAGQLGAAGLCALVLTMGGLLASWRERVPWAKAARVGVVIAPYAAWVLLAQNVEHARHAAPLVVALLLAAALLVSPALEEAAGATGGWPLRLAAVAAVLMALSLSLRGPVAEARREPDGVAAVRWVAARSSSSPVLLLGQHVPRLASLYAPTLRTGLARTGDDVRRIAERFGAGVTVLCTSEIRDLDAAPPLSPLAEFGALRLYAVGARSDATSPLAIAAQGRP